MILEDLGFTSPGATVGDILNALADFPIGSGEGLLSGWNGVEDGLDDVASIGELGRRPRRRPRPRPRPRRPRPRPYPYYTPPVVLGPQYVETEPIDAASTTSVSAYQAAMENRRRLKAIEKKMKELHPKKVKLMKDGIEGLGAVFMPRLDSATKASKTLMQIGAIAQAAHDPSSRQAKVIAYNLKKKSEQLEKLAKDRLALASNAVKDYHRDKNTVDRIERVARKKAELVVDTAAAHKDSPDIARKMEGEIKDVRRLHDRSVGLGRRAVQEMKLYGLASLLSKNASAQAMVAKAASEAVAKGKPDEARVLAAALNRHAETARKLKITRKKQLALWSSDDRNSKYHRLANRRERYLKAIALLTQKSSTAGLSQEDQAALRDAHAKLAQVEIAMQGIRGGGVRPAAIPKKPRTLHGLEQAAVFSVDMPPNDPSGTFLTGFSNLGALYVPHFAMDNNEYPNVAATFFPWNYSGGMAGLDQYDEKTPDSVVPILYPWTYSSGGGGPQGWDLGAMKGVAKYEPQFSVDMKKLPKQGQWFSGFAALLLGNGGDLAADTALGLEGFFDFISKPMKAGAVRKAVNSALNSAPAIASGNINPVKMVGAASWSQLKSAPASSLSAARQSLQSGSKGISGEVWRQARGVYNYAKSPINSVCGAISSGGFKTIGNVTSSPFASRYAQRLCGKSGSALRTTRDPSIASIYAKARESAAKSVVGAAPKAPYYANPKSAAALPQLTTREQKKALLKERMKERALRRQKQNFTKKAIATRNQQLLAFRKRAMTLNRNIAKLTKMAQQPGAVAELKKKVQKQLKQEMRKLRQLGDWTVYDPIWATGADLGNVPTDFPKIYEPIRKQWGEELGALPGGFPHLYDPLSYVKRTDLGNVPTDFPDFFEPRAIMTVLEGAAIAAPVLLS